MAKTIGGMDADVGRIGIYSQRVLAIVYSFQVSRKYIAIFIYHGSLAMVVAVFIFYIPHDSIFDKKPFSGGRYSYACVVINKIILCDAGE